MSRYYADFHIHTGRSQGRPVKMAAAPSLTVDAAITHARVEKGLDLITLIDGVCTNVLADLKQMVTDGRIISVPGGGYQSDNGLVILLGAEIEVRGPLGGAAHFGCWFADLDAASDFNGWLSTVQKNTTLSSQRAAVNAQTLQEQTQAHHGLFIVHHAFTPHKGLYGNCVTRLKEMVDPLAVDALELGLSADSNMADCLSDLANVSFITNSDAHSLPKIAREYNAFEIDLPSFTSVKDALHRRNNQAIVANYGLEPALGKYHRTRCATCGRAWSEDAARCQCGSTRLIPGVSERLLAIRDGDCPVTPSHRPPYVYQVPLEFVPGLGPKTMRRLLDAFGTEMAILHQASFDALCDVVGTEMAHRIECARTGDVSFVEGGGGTYGKITYRSI